MNPQPNDSEAMRQAERRIEQLRRVSEQDKSYTWSGLDMLWAINYKEAELASLREELEKLRNRHDSNCILLHDGGNVLCDCSLSRSKGFNREEILQMLADRNKELAQAQAKISALTKAGDEMVKQFEALYGKIDCEVNIGVKSWRNATSMGKDKSL